MKEWYCYLLHFSAPVGHARHYLGTSCRLEARLADHAAGCGARLTQVARQRGVSFVHVATWPGGRAKEIALKSRGSRARLCPLCACEQRALRRACYRRSRARRESRACSLGLAESRRGGSSTPQSR